MGIDKKEKFIRTPVYLNGTAGIKQFVKENLKYPIEAFKAKIEATVHVKYIIDSNGDVIEAKTVGHVGYGLDEEAIRVVKLLKFSKVRNRNLRVTFNRKLDIHFRMPGSTEIPAKMPQATGIHVQYTYTTPQSEQKEEKPGSFQYKITIK